MLTSLKNREYSFLFLIFLLIVSGFLLGRAIALDNYNFMLVAASVFFLFLVLKSNIISISLIILFCFFGNWLETLEIMPAQFNWTAEIIVALLFLKAVAVKIFRKERIQFNFIWIFILFLGVSTISYIFTNVPLIHIILFFRLLFRYYILFLAVVNLDFNEKTISIISYIIIFLFIIQIPTAFLKFLRYGQGERAIGTYAHHGGANSIVIPLISISFLVAFYFFYKSAKLYILLILGFVAFGLVGGKRGIILFVPILLIFLGWQIRDHFKNVYKYIFVASILILLTGYFSIKFIPTLNPQGIRGGEVNFLYLTQFFSSYTTQTKEDGATAGRVSTSINVFYILQDGGLRNILFGLGPGSYIETRFEEIEDTLKETEELPILYGITGLTWIALQTGYMGALIYLLLFCIILVRSFQYFKLEHRPYWKSFGLGMFGFSFVMLFINAIYHPVMIDDLIPMLFFLLTAFTIKLKNNLNSSQSTA